MSTEFNNSLRSYAINEELHRRNTSANELIRLNEIFREEAARLSSEDLKYLKDSILESIESDLAKCQTLTTHIALAEANNQTPTFNLQFHKIEVLLNGAKEIIASQWDKLTSKPLEEIYPLDPREPTWQGGTESNIMGSGTAAFVQMALLKALSVHSGEAIAHIRSLQEAGIYQLDDSPNLQSTKLPELFATEELRDTYNEWSFFFQDTLSPNSGELVYPTMGYTFGGSREDERYHDKLHRAEDCSSVVAKWLGAQEPFSTIHLAWLHENYFLPDYETKLLETGALLGKEDPEFIACVRAAALVMIPKTTTPEPGDIFVFRKYNLDTDPEKENVLGSKGGHCGVVTDVDTNACFTSLTYARDLEADSSFEGLVYNYESPSDYEERKYWFFEPLTVADDPFSYSL